MEGMPEESLPSSLQPYKACWPHVKGLGHPQKPLARGPTVGGSPPGPGKWVVAGPKKIQQHAKAPGRSQELPPLEAALFQAQAQAPCPLQSPTQSQSIPPTPQSSLRDLQTLRRTSGNVHDPTSCQGFRGSCPGMLAGEDLSIQVLETCRQKACETIQWLHFTDGKREALPSGFLCYV